MKSVENVLPSDKGLLHVMTSVGHAGWMPVSMKSTHRTTRRWGWRCKGRGINRYIVLHSCVHVKIVRGTHSAVNYLDRPVLIPPAFEQPSGSVWNPINAATLEEHGSMCTLGRYRTC